LSAISRSSHHDAPTLREDTMWALVGALAQAGGQLLTMIVLTHYVATELVGQYALGLAVATPLNVFADRAIRMLQATSSESDFPLRDYLGFRVFLGSLAFLCTVILLIVWRMELTGTQVILLVALGRFVEGIEQTLYGRLHRSSQMRHIGQSQVIRAVAAFVSLVAVLSVCRRLELALAVSLGANLIVLDCLDRRRVDQLESPPTGRQRPLRSQVHVALPSSSWMSLARLALPLALSTFLVAVTASLPRLYLARTVNEHTLGVFAILCYLCFPATMLVSAIMQAATPRLADLYRLDAGRYRQLFARLFSVCAVLALGNWVFVALAGRPVLQFLFGPDYAVASDHLDWIAAASGVGFLATVPATALSAHRIFRATLVTCGLSCIVCGISGAMLIPRYSLTGAVAVMLLSSTVHFCTAGVGWWWTCRHSE
jgi:O-antigen/teichoic acid export membrane protein